MLSVAELPTGALEALLSRYALHIERVAEDEPIPGSYWGAPEAGLIGERLFACAGTPVHSVLHEASHFVCMDDARRAGLDRDAGGDHAEENAVCYLQIVLADYLRGMSRDRMLADMDAWGYTFRLGSARAWFERDAEDARAWLIAHGIVEFSGGVTWRLRTGRGFV